MFTGLVESCGVLKARTPNASGMRLVITSDFEDLVIGESIAVNGVCLTVLESAPGELAFDISPETESLTSLGQLNIGDKVHLERALCMQDRLGGHYVTGHVDTTATVASIVAHGDCIEMEIAGFNASEMRYLCPKGSVTLDGVSLTINAVHDTSITVMLIPHTLKKTTLGTWKLGTAMNVEFDYIARVVVHQLGSLTDSTIISPFKCPDEGKEVLV